MDKYIVIDGININASFFGKMKEKEAVERMLKEGIEIPGSTAEEKKEWAKSAHSILKAGLE